MPERGEASEDPVADFGIDHVDHQGVWLFAHHESDHADALLSAEASIAGGCLRVGGEVIVWPESRLSEARRIVDVLLDGRSPGTITLGGGETTTEVSARTGILDRCSTGPVWFAAPRAD